MVSTTLGWFLLCVLHPIFGYENWNLRVPYNFLVPAAKHYLFIEPQRNKNFEGSISFDNVLLAICGYLINLVSNLQFGLIACVLGTASITIWVATTNFIESVQTGSFRNYGKKANEEFGCCRQFSIVQLHDKFNELLKLVNAVNEAWSFLIFSYLFFSAVWYSTNLDRVIKYQGYFLRIFVISNMVYNTVSVLLSAESSRKVRFTFAKKLLDMRKNTQLINVFNNF